MRNFLSLLLVCITTVSAAQVHCDGVRYIEPTFTSIDSTLDIQYGENITIGGNSKILLMDVYSPQEFFFERPLLVMAHGGSFIGGNRKQLRPLCLEMASRGYVVATINYRLFDDWSSNLDSILASDVAIKATMDMKAAVRWFRENAKGANDFGIDTNLIFAGGVSAGAITALHLAYLDTLDYAQGTVVDSIIQANGGIRGTSSSNYQYSDNVRGVMNFSGALKDARWIDAGEPVVFSAHDDGDDVVPYDRAITNTLGTPVELWGSFEVNEQAREDGIRSQLITIENSSGHVSYFMNPNSSNYDLVVDSASYFLEYEICERINQIEPIQAPELVLYPNPAADLIEVRSPQPILKIEILDANGRSISQRRLGKLQVIDVSDLSTGVYTLRMLSEEGVWMSERFVRA